MRLQRRLPVGAEVQEQGVHFRVWAPDWDYVAVVLEPGLDDTPHTPQSHPLQREDNGYFSGLVGRACPGTYYRYRLGDTGAYPDPASRFQPEGPSGPSCVIDPSAFPWTDDAWTGIEPRDHVLYEMHIGTFTPEGTWAAAMERLEGLRDLGITTIEVMPVADFPGRFGWSYDGTCLFAPTRLYGTPDDFRRFVNRAHELGLAVILDVVYNHMDADGNILKIYSPDYFVRDYNTEWGAALDFSGPRRAAVREFVLANVACWIEEFHLDGLRLDATQSLYDNTSTHIAAEINAAVRRAAGRRKVFVVAENEPQHTRLIRPATEGGYDIDAAVNDDFHHAAYVALTGHNDAYFSGYLGLAQEFVSLAKRGYLYQGEYYAWQKKGRGTPTGGLAAFKFVHYLESHDQIANTGLGLRLHTLCSAANYRAMTAVLLLFPQVPMLFQGQEFNASAKFVYFSDHRPECAERVSRSRYEFISQFPRLRLEEVRRRLPQPGDPGGFMQCKLDFRELDRNRETYLLHKDLLRLRREDRIIRGQPRGIDGAVLARRCFVIRYFGEDGDDRLLIVNLGDDLPVISPEPLLAPPEGGAWKLRWSSECPDYGGSGTAINGPDAPWFIPGSIAIVMAPEQAGDK